MDLGRFKLLRVTYYENDQTITGSNRQLRHLFQILLTLFKKGSETARKIEFPKIDLQQDCNTSRFFLFPLIFLNCWALFNLIKFLSQMAALDPPTWRKLSLKTFSIVEQKDINGERKSDLWLVFRIYFVIIFSSHNC